MGIRECGNERKGGREGGYKGKLIVDYGSEE